MLFRSKIWRTFCFFLSQNSVNRTRPKPKDEHDLNVALRSVLAPELPVQLECVITRVYDHQKMKSWFKSRSALTHNSHLIAPIARNRLSGRSRQKKKKRKRRLDRANSCSSSHKIEASGGKLALTFAASSLAINTAAITNPVESAGFFRALTKTTPTHSDCPQLSPPPPKKKREKSFKGRTETYLKYL